jgi:hypothetical protein
MSESSKYLSIFPPVIDHLNKKHEILRNDYIGEDGVHSESCTIVGCDIAGLLLRNGDKPYLIAVRGEETTETGWIHNKPIIPKIYNGRVVWGGHIVCAVGDIVLDPMVGKPMTTEEYKREVFTEPVNLETQVSSESIREFLERGSKEQKIKDVVRNEIAADKNFFFENDPSQFELSLQRVFSRKLIEELKGDILDTPQDVYGLDFIETRLSDGHWNRRNFDFMLLENDLVPLGTHVAEQASNFKVYRLNENLDGITEAIPVQQYLLDRFPDDITLTRVLSEEEALKFANGDTRLGSSHSVFWQDTVHTAVHNITNEFENSVHYQKAIKFKLKKTEIAKLVELGEAKLGTYSFVFKKRDQNSPFPFDLEAAFYKGAIPTLLEGYQRWVREVEQPYIENPFYEPLKS